MATIVLVQCTSMKEGHPCMASQMYQRSPRFRLSYQYARNISDKVYILSAKYGLLKDEQIIEPYNEYLKEKSSTAKKQWAINVLMKLREEADLDHDQFVILAGKSYYEWIIPSLKNYLIPLKGKTQGQWIPSLKNLIRDREGFSGSKCEALHILFNGMQKLDWTMINSLTFTNGIYIMFEKDETYKGMDRIVRIGTHHAQDGLKRRLRNHFINENADASIFRKNIGRALLNKDHDQYLGIWDLNTSKHEIVAEFGRLIDENREIAIENQVSQYLRENISYVCIKVDDPIDRTRFEEALISELNHEESFQPSAHWLGLHNPEQRIANSGLWNVQGLNGNVLTDDEFKVIEGLVGLNGATGLPGTQTLKSKELIKNNQQLSTISAVPKTKIYNTADDIRRYIDNLFIQGRCEGKQYIDLVSGQIHRDLELESRMPQVCRIMYEKKGSRDEILSTTPSGKSSTIKIRYYL